LNLLEKLRDLLKSKNVLLTGGAGVGKSYLTSELIRVMKKEGKQIVVLGSTGVSAVNINGQTIHSFFAFGICSSLDELKRHDKYTKQRVKELNKILSSADLVIIDEISMVSANLLDMIQARIINSNFRGSLLFVGDFFQLPPVKSKQTSDNLSLFGEAEFAFESSAWGFFEPCIVELKTTKRTTDEYFFQILNKIRTGIYDSEVGEYLFDLQNNLHVKNINPTILYGRNREADIKNLQKLEELQAPKVTLQAKEKSHVSSLNVSRIQSWKNALPIPIELALKVGAVVLFCTNKWGHYYNGERGVIRGIDDEYLEVEKANGQLVKVVRQEYTMHENIILNNQIEERPLISIEQFPIKLAYAITIHKSQGMSIDNLVCNIDNIFEKSQFYVAISRAKDPKNLMIDFSFHQKNFDNHLKRCIQVSPKVSSFYNNTDIIDIEKNLEATLF
jgi:ATP-dependent exoDNAse (exonuclease V) alpha subunit